VHLNGLPFDQQVAWTGYQLFRGLQPVKDFHLGTHVLADRDWSKVNSPVTAHNDVSMRQRLLRGFEETFR
jgi:hypothetical protein